MAHPQNTPRGLLAKNSQINVGAQEITANSTALLISGGVRVSAQSVAIITGDSTGIIVSGGVKISNKANAVITGNSTGIVLVGGIKISNKVAFTANSTTHIVNKNPLSALPTSKDSGVAWQIVSNSTGVAFVVNSTGTTWKYLLTTSVQPT